MQISDFGSPITLAHLVQLPRPPVRYHVSWPLVLVPFVPHTKHDTNIKQHVKS
jgi:hypothetical protein